MLRPAVRRRAEYEELIINGVFAMDSSETSTERLLGELAAAERSRGARPDRRPGSGLHRRRDFCPGCRRDRRRGDRAVFDRLGPSRNHCDAGGRRFRSADSVPRRVTSASPSRRSIDGLVGPWDAIVLDVDNGPDFLIHRRTIAPFTPSRACGRRTLSSLLAARLAIWCQGPARRCAPSWNALGHRRREHIIEVSRGERRIRVRDLYTVRGRRTSSGDARPECAP